MVEQSQVTVTNSSPEVEPSPVKICTHHWMIESPQGETSMGKCKLCGDKRSFQNYNNSGLYPRRYSQSGQEAMERREYYREVGISSRSIRSSEGGILPKNGTIGGRF